MTQHKHKLGWKRQLPDHRDHLYLAAPEVVAALPSKVDLRGPNMPDPYDQRDLGACTAHSIAGAIQFDRRKTGKTPDYVPSRLFIYYNERAIEHTIRTDAGANLRDGIKSVVTQGVCPEDIWPYVDTPADPNTSLWPASAVPAKKPSKKCYMEALGDKVVSYKAVQQNLAQIRGCLASGFPICAGFTVYDTMWDANGNPVTHLPMPGPNDQVAGGHAILICGYSDDTREFTIRNSWGKDCQDGGYFYMPYAYLTNSNLASDFWVINSTSS